MLFAVVLLALPVVAAAQSSQSGTSSPAPLPSIGLPLPDIGLPLGPAMPTVDKPGDKSKRRADRKAPPSRRPPGADDRRRGRGQSRTVYVVPTYPAWWNYPVPDPAPAPSAQVPQQEPAPVPAPEPVRPTGTLALEVNPPGSAQVYVDDFYIGTIDEVGRELTLETGAHNVQLRATGYETLNINVKIDEGRTITYRESLRSTAGETPAPAQEARAASAAPIKKKPIYAIPGCYLGDVPPKEANLPPGCDPNKAITIKP
jgi:hypothetical protein